jgi:4-hydroxy-tetrahydrodipicolinate synthase
MKREFRGIWSPMPTPLARNGDVDISRLRELTDYLIEGGIDGLFPLGTTGEFAFFSKQERRKIVETVVDQGNGRVPILAGVSDPDSSAVIGYAKDAKDAGADALMATPPYYFPLSQESIYDHYVRIHSATSLPLLLYNIPQFTHNFVEVPVVERLASEEVIAGMKYTEYNLLNLLQFIGAVGKVISVMTGSDAMAETCLEYGGSGAIISVSNIAPRKAASIYDLASKGDFAGARKAQFDLLPAIQAAGLGFFPAGLKEAMAVSGFPVGGLRQRHTTLSKEDKDQVRRLLSQAGITRRG